MEIQYSDPFTRAEKSCVIYVSENSFLITYTKHENGPFSQFIFPRINFYDLK